MGLGLFKRSREKWLSSFDQKQKAKELFSDFIKNDKTVEKTEKEEEGFVIDKKGNHDTPILKRAVDESTEKSFSPKKKAKKSYLDDL